LIERLRDLIVRGRITPGARLSPPAIAKRLGVGRVAALEAMRRLEQEGFLVGIGAGKRAQLIVAPLTAADLLDLYELMATLEGAAARQVARLPQQRRQAVGRELKGLDQAYQQLGRAVDPDYDRLFEAHRAVHACFVTAAPAPRLRAVIAKFRPQVDRYEYVYAPLVGPDETTFREHTAMVTELHSGSPDAAEDAVRESWLNRGQRLKKKLARIL
jgi:DNA-binding GntR family transcriptional regulator